MARPREINVDDIIKKLNEYIAVSEEPLIQEFILNYGISNSRFYDLAKENEELSETIKKAIAKQEVFIVRGAERGTLNATFCIFRLKQKCFGYKDKQEVEHSGGVKQEIKYSNLSDEELEKELDKYEQTTED